MENVNEIQYVEPKYTKTWLISQILLSLVYAGILTALAFGISSFAGSRLSDGFLSVSHYNFLEKSTNYCFIMITLTLMSVTLIELYFRRGANIAQMILIGAALCLFYLLLLSIAEHVPFWGAYAIVSAMIIGLLSWFIKAIVGKAKAAKSIAMILTAEYGLILLMVYLGSMVLLVGSVLLFALLALAMYLTLRLKIENEELILK